jgi:hypothetical protein
MYKFVRILGTYEILYTVHLQQSGSWLTGLLTTTAVSIYD